MSGSVSVSVVMVSFRTGPALLEAVRAVRRAADIDELIVVDNGNGPASRRALFRTAFEAGPDDTVVRLLQGHGNIGFARGCNYGAAMARGTHLFFLNPDALVEDGAAQALVAAGQGATAPWLCGGMLLGPDEREQRGPRRGRLDFASAFASFTPLHRLPGIRSIHRTDEPLPDGPVPMPTVSGASLLTDRASFARLGGFDEGYFLHVEDIDLCHRARLAGGSVMFVPQARAMHYGSTSKVTRLRVEWLKYKGFLRYFWRASPGPGGKIATVLAAPFMGAALMGRAIWLTARAALSGR